MNEKVQLLLLLGGAAGALALQTLPDGLGGRAHHPALDPPHLLRGPAALKVEQRPSGGVVALGEQVKQNVQRICDQLLIEHWKNTGTKDILFPYLLRLGNLFDSDL